MVSPPFRCKEQEKWRSRGDDTGHVSISWLVLSPQRCAQAADAGELKPKCYCRARIFLTLGWYQNTVALIIENFIPHETNDSCRYSFAESASSDALANADCAGDLQIRDCIGSESA